MVREWSTDDFELVSEHVAPPGGFWSVAYLPDGRLLTSDVTGAVATFDLRDGSTGEVFAGDKTRESGIAVSSDGSLAAAAADGDLVRVWSVADGRVVAELPGHDAPVTAVSFTSDGSSLISGSLDATAIIWSRDES
jgi:cytochrome c